MHIEIGTTAQKQFLHLLQPLKERDHQLQMQRHLACNCCKSGASAPRLINVMALFVYSLSNHLLLKKDVAIFDIHTKCFMALPELTKLKSLSVYKTTRIMA